MADDAARQVLTDQITAELYALQGLAADAAALYMRAQIKVGNCTVDLSQIDPTQLQVWLNHEFQTTLTPTPTPTPTPSGP
jgi:hypothetical protein